MPLRKRPSLDPTQRLRLIPGMDTTATATGHTDMATTATDLTDMATTERGLLMPSQLLKLLPTLRLRLIPGMDTTATATGHTDMATTATGLMVMLTGVKRYSDLSLPTLLWNTSFCKTIFFLYWKTVLFCVLGCRVLCSIIYNREKINISNGLNTISFLHERNREKISIM